VVGALGNAAHMLYFATVNHCKIPFFERCFHLQIFAYIIHTHTKKVNRWSVKTLCIFAKNVAASALHIYAPAGHNNSELKK